MKKNILLMIASLLITTVTLGQNEARRQSQFNLEKKVALQGYDPVGYFKKNKAVEGKKEIASAYQGVTYYFSSDENRQLFLKNPAAYEPQYGGWCAYAMGASGEKVEVDPGTFKIIDGKLFLFYNAYFNNTLKSWNNDEANLKKKADMNWKKFYNQ